MTTALAEVVAADAAARTTTRARRRAAPRRAAAQDPDPSPTPPGEDQDAEDHDAAADSPGPAAAPSSSRPRSGSGSGGDAGGVLLAVLLYPLVLAFIKGGPTRAKQLVQAKLLNVTPGEQWQAPELLASTPGSSGVSSFGADGSGPFTGGAGEGTGDGGGDSW